MRFRPTAALTALAGLAALATLAACGKDEARPAAASPLLTSPDPAGPVPDVAAAARDPELLRAALLRPHHASAAALGPHALTATSSVKVSEDGAEVMALEIVEGFEVGAGGDWHLRHANSKDYGREVFFRPAAGGDGTLWLRPGVGKYHRRPPAEPDEPARLLDETFGTLAADFDLVAAGAQVTDAGAVDLGGRPARKVTLAVGPARPRVEPLPQRSWRQEVVVQSLTGELTLDVATGLLLAGRLEATLTFVRQGRRYEMRLAATHAVALGEAAAGAITPPGDADSVDTPGRSTDVADRDELLRGIAPPAKKK